MRLQLALRGTMSVGLAGTALALTAYGTGRPLTDFAIGAVFTMPGTFVLRDAEPRSRLVTLLALFLTAVASACITSAVHAVPLAGEVLLLGVWSRNIVGTRLA